MNSRSLLSPHRQPRWLALLTALAAIGVWLASGPPASAQTGGVVVHVQGNHLVGASGATIRLLGVNRSGTEYACAEGWGIFDGPSTPASIEAMRSWNIDAVRVPLNEDCWLGINGANPAYSGTNYRAAIENYVGALNAQGLIAVLDLHWSAPGSHLAVGQQEMADADHSPLFWRSVATAFKSDPGVIFDLYNEPHDISWTCWLNGCYVAAGWKAAGMQSLVDAVRSTGAGQPLMIAGDNWASDLSSWSSHEPVDPDHQLIAEAHIYDYNQCNNSTCWNDVLAPLAQKVPLVTGELGETDCGTGFIGAYMPWADRHGVSYLGWSWDTASCSKGPALITNYDGQPTTYGAGFEHHLQSLPKV